MPVSPGGHRQFKVWGMDCAEEIAALKRELGPLVGGEDRLGFDLLKARLTVAAPAEAAADQAILAAVERTGMRAEPWQEGAETVEKRGLRERRGRALMTAASGVATAAGFAVHAVLAGGVAAALGSEGALVEHDVPVGARLLYLVGTVTGAWHVAPRGWHALRRLRPDMNLLMTVAVAGAIGIGEWLEASTVAFLFALSLALESWSVGRARRAIAALLDLAPQLARVRRRDGSEEEVPATEVAVGSDVVVRPGERIPLDGRVTAGRSGVNQAPITGESLPVERRAGDEVFAGTINGDGALEVETTKPAAETVLARIVHMVEEAQSRRAPAEQWVERFARVYTPAVMGLALLLGLLPPLLGGDWREWFYRTLVLLVIACPCALVISTPVSIVAGLAAAARAGVLIKSGLFLELPARLRAVALDKTGTLTYGRPAVVAVVPLADHDERGLLERAAAIESRSEHPLARAILEHAKDRDVVVRPAKDFRILQGRGATATLDGKEYWLGSHRFLEERGQETPSVHAELEALAAAGRSAVVVGTNDHVCGVIGIADTVRAESTTAVHALREARIERVVMLTGDNEGTARAIAAEVGVDEAFSELLPADKVTAIEELLTRYRTVGMVGDGVNDAPAMARASLSIAMGGAGTDAAIETADVTFMADDLGKLPWLIRHSRRTLAVIRQNIAFSLVVKATFVVLALAGHASLWSAIAADMGASLLVIANGLRLLRR